MATVDPFEYSRVWTDPADFPSISYQKDWNSSDDFPTIETDEAQVRSDMQSLYDEIADYINGTANAPDSDARWLNKGLRQYVVATGGAEETRIAQEEQRQKNENGYTDEEEVFHNGRVQNETARQTAETARDEAETARDKAENGYTDEQEVFHNGRVQNEAARVSAENERVLAEQARADETSGIVAQATTKANAAAASATEAQSYAKGGTSSRAGEDTDNAKYYSQQAAGSATTASTKAGEASGSATTAAAKATLSESWAVGGTNTRTGEDTNNAKYWSEQAQAAAGGGVTSFNSRTGVVTPQDGDYITSLTKAEYDDLVDAGTVDPNMLYCITDDTGATGFPYTQAQTDALLAMKAPAGYGLGGVSAQLTALDDLDDITANGWYFWGSGDVPAHAPMEGGAKLLVVCYGASSSANQIYFRNDMVLMRRKDGTWYPWEYINPPLVAGVEYRTTERFAGKPVYQKLVYISAGPAGSVSTPARVTPYHGAANVDVPVSITGYMRYKPSSSNTTMPYMALDGATMLYANWWLTPSVIAIYSNIDMSTNDEFYAIIKYTKTTD